MEGEPPGEPKLFFVPQTVRPEPRPPVLSVTRATERLRRCWCLSKQGTNYELSKFSCDSLTK